MGDRVTQEISIALIGNFDMVFRSKEEKNMFTYDRKDTALGLMLEDIASKIVDKAFLQFTPLGATDS